MRLICLVDGDEKVTAYHEDGSFLKGEWTGDDLVSIPFKRAYVNVYRSGSRMHPSKKEAKEAQQRGLIACLETFVPIND